MSQRTLPPTIQCPKCQQSIPGWAEKCQFCGHAITQGYVRPTDAYKYKIDTRMGWHEVGYIVTSIVMILQGISLLLQCVGVLGSIFPPTAGAFLGMVGTLYIAAAVGLLMQLGWVQYTMKLLCYLAVIVWAGLALMYTMARHPLVPVLYCLFSGMVIGFLVYFINTVGDA